MKIFFAILLLVFSFSFSAKSQIIFNPGYDYPIENPYLATLTAAANSTTLKYKVVSVEIRPDRNRIPLVSGRHLMKVGLFKQRHQAPLVFVIAGLGAGGSSGSSLMIAESLFKNGYHVATLPNPFSWQYTLGVSESTAPGHVARDSKEYYVFMQHINNYLRNYEGVDASSYSLVGYSLGGLYSAFLSKIDSDLKAFDFKKTLLINPAIDLKFGLRILDGFYNEGARLTENRKGYITSVLLSAGQTLVDSPLSVQSLSRVMPQISRLDNSDYKWLIGKSFRDSVRDIIFASQQVKDVGVLKVRATPGRQSARLFEAEQFSFQRYITEVLQPTVPNGTIEEVLKNSSLHSLRSYLRRNPNIFVFENADDMIINQNDIEFLKNSFGRRLNLYPRGGHMGNLWWERNKADLAAVFPKQ